MKEYRIRQWNGKGWTAPITYSNGATSEAIYTNRTMALRTISMFKANYKAFKASPNWERFRKNAIDWTIKEPIYAIQEREVTEWSESE